jgi:predicted porin
MKAYVRQTTIVTSLGLACAAPMAFADDSSAAESPIILYGKVYPELNWARGSGATPAGTAVSTLAAAPTGTSGIVQRTEMNGSNSYLGVRGSERLGGGLAAIFQLETEFRVDQNTTTFANRDSFVGLRGGFGTVRLGRMDTVFKKWGETLGFLNVNSGNIVSTANVLRSVGFGSNAAASFHLRRQNAIDYTTPRLGGFEAAVQYSTDEAKTATRNPEVWSGGIRYDNGPFYAAVNHERHRDLFGGSRNVPAALSNFADQSVRSKDEATQLAAVYRLGAHSFEVDYVRKKYSENPTVTGRFKEYTNGAYMLIADSRWSKSWRTAFHWVRSQKGSCTRVAAACSTDGLEGDQVSLGGAYYFSPRTYAFGFVQWLRNGRSAQFNTTPMQAPSVGEDLTQYAIGLAHAF